MNASQEQLPPEMLLTQAPFNSIFPIQTPVLQRIVDRMKKIGFEIVTDRGDYKADI